MRIFLAGLLILVFHITIVAQTNVSGFISTNTVWDTLNDPYIITSNVLVNSGVKLTIMPGTVVKFNSLRALQIDGELNVLGTANNRVTFTANSPNPTSGFWDAIIFTVSSNSTLLDVSDNYVSGNLIKYADFLHGGYATNVNDQSGMIECKKSTLYIENCTFTNSASEGLFFADNPTGFNYASIVKDNILKSCGIIYVMHGNKKKVLNNKVDNGGIWLMN